MHSFRFGKFQYFLYAILNEFFHLMFLLCCESSAGVLLKKWNPFLIALILVTIILVPCLQKIGFGFDIQDIRKFHNGYSHIMKMAIQIDSEIFPEGELGRIEGHTNWQKGFSQFGGSFVKLVDVNGLKVAGASHPIRNDFTNNEPHDAPNRNTNAEVKCDHWRYLAIGFSVGGWFVIFCLRILPFLVFIFTQQLIYGMPVCSHF